jgi:hypothetical protein
LAVQICPQAALEHRSAIGLQRLLAREIAGWALGAASIGVVVMAAALHARRRALRRMSR